MAAAVSSFTGAPAARHKDLAHELLEFTPRVLTALFIAGVVSSHCPENLQGTVVLLSVGSAIASTPTSFSSKIFYSTVMATEMAALRILRMC